MTAYVWFVQCCSVKDVLDGVGTENRGDESAIANGAYDCCGGRREDVDAQGFEAQRGQGEHESGAEMASRAGDKDIVC